MKQIIWIALGWLTLLTSTWALGDDCPARITTNDAADCIERHTYSPCDLGNSIGIADCAWAYAEVEDRKIRKLEKQILKVFASRNLGENAAKSFKEWQEEWRKYRASSCQKSNSLADIIVADKQGIVENGTDFHLGFCIRHTNERRVLELTRFLEISRPDN